jgi:2-methylcitrate dehydratase
MDRVVDAITSYATSLSYADLPQAVIAQAKHLIIDSVGCALGAATSPPATIVSAIARGVRSDTPATLMLSGLSTTPDLAAFANGCLIRYLDYNDTYIGTETVHPSDMLAPALATAESMNGDGRALIVGFVLGYEVLANLTDNGAMRRGERGPQWDQSTYGAIAAATVSATLMGLSKEQIGHAISLAAASHLAIGQIRTGQISHWKGCAVANASRNGVFCATLAAQGMTGPAEIFEGPRGFFKATGGPFDMLPFGGGDAAFRIMSARIKPYPAGYYAQSAIEAALQVRPGISRLDDVQTIRLETFPAGYSAMGSDKSRWSPETRESADHSLPFMLAMALMDGDVTTRHYDEGRFKHEDVRALMAKISISVGEESKGSPDAALSVVHIDLADGRTLTAKVAQHLGHFKRPMSDAQLEAKFRPMAEDYAGLPREQANRLLERLRHIDEITDIRSLLALTIVPT